MKYLIIGISLSALIIYSAQAATTVTHYVAGTGFFVSPSGYIITNEHVVRECAGNVTIDGAISGEAEIVAVDKEYDLALLNATLNAPSTAPLRAADLNMSVGDPVLVMGYPLDAITTGHYKIAESKVVGLRGPGGEEKWLQFSDAAQHGNSGGPLLDYAGNVIGVITGKSEQFTIDPNTRERTSTGHSDFAITLPVLKSFLTRNRVPYQSGDATTLRSQGMIETEAQRFILSIKCVINVEKR